MPERERETKESEGYTGIKVFTLKQRYPQGTQLLAIEKISNRSIFIHRNKLRFRSKYDAFARGSSVCR